MKKERGKPKSKNEDIEIIESDSDLEVDFVKKLKEVKEKLKQCNKEKQEYLDGWQRAKADFVNTMKENEKARKELMQFAREDILSQIFPVVDSFEMAFANKKAWENIDTNWRNGIEHIYSQLISVLKENKFIQINPIDEKFNPSIHESIESVSVDKKDKEDRIVEVVQKGYMMNDRIIRPARVKVGIYKA